VFQARGPGRIKNEQGPVRSRGSFIAKDKNFGMGPSRKMGVANGALKRRRLVGNEMGAATG